MPDRKPRAADRDNSEAGTLIRRRSRIGGGTATGALREEQLTEKDKKTPDHGPTLPLKNSGGQLDLDEVRHQESNLRRLLERDPEQFQALREIVEGRGEAVSKKQRHELRSRGYLGRDGSPLPGVQEVMAAGLRQTPDGLCIVDPVELKTPEDAGRLRQADEQREARRREGFRRLWDELEKPPRRDEEGKDRSR